MKNLILAFSTILYSSSLYSQSEHQDSLVEHHSTPVSIEAKKNKEIIKLSADLRYRGVYLENEDFGESPHKSESYSLFRALTGVRLAPTKNLSFFGQVQSSLIASKQYQVSPVDRNELDLHQASAEFSQGKLAVRFGRQELSYGSQRLISVREIPNNRQAFDGIKTSYKAGNTSLDLLYTTYVKAKEGIFDDEAFKGPHLWGAYLTNKKLAGPLGAELYYLGLHKQKAAFANRKGAEERHSIGTRLFVKNAGINYDLEAVYQFGSIGKTSISAWTISSYLQKKYSAVPLKPMVELKTDVISGDNNREGKFGTFNPLFPKGAYFGLAALIGPANLLDIHPSLGLEINPDKLMINLESLFLWRYSVKDGVYGANGALAFNAPESNERYIGSQFAGTLNYTPIKNFLLRAELTFFNTGDFLKAASPGKDMVFAAITTQIKL
ncbi:alginate export family protein [Desertivirga arenae]|uniref:alginate export family protein n=1 Tax=Desertivirga arenae TaxID=2810309 RepID=UPI001A9631A0|nr:alginate export family protein [Pedobacter sp. SYSU D00823]